MTLFTKIKNLFRKKKKVFIYKISAQDSVNSISDKELYVIVKKIMGKTNTTEKHKTFFIVLPKDNQLH